MIGISKLYCGTQEPSDSIRYSRAGQGQRRRPIVVWNCTQRCNLKCAHCYASSTSAVARGELSTAQAKAMIDDIAAFGAPVLLFSGGEPLLRPDVLDLMAHASGAGLRVVLSSNGTLISEDLARRLALAGLSYAGISLDGSGVVNDNFRGLKGAYQAALRGIANCQQAGVKVGLRLTMNRGNVQEIPALFELLKKRDIPRICFYHLVSAGRGLDISDQSLKHDQTRQAIDTIIDLTAKLHEAGKKVQVLTVDNHADGPYLLMRMAQENSGHYEQAYKLLKANGGNASGQLISCVSWNGDVMPDQFWRQHVLGNVRSRPFSEIWSDNNIELLAQLRQRGKFLTGRCQRCRWMDVCNGNFRARAQAAGDMWGDDPACYLSEQEIAPE